MTIIDWKTAFEASLEQLIRTRQELRALREDYEEARLQLASLRCELKAMGCDRDGDRRPSWWPPRRP